MKKLVSIVMTISMAMSLAACGASSSSADTTASTAAADAGTDSNKGKVAFLVGALGDKSFSDSGEAGMQILKSEGWDEHTFELGDASKADKYEDEILDVIDQGYEYIIGYSTYMEIMANLAKEYPDVKFIGFDANWTDDQLPDNMTCIFYAQNEGSYLVGMLAAGMTKTGTIAVDVGVESPVINDFVTGFVNGVIDYNAANGTDVKVVKAAVDSWSDPAKMKEIVLDQARNNNADVFYQVAGGSGDGLFEACTELNDVWAIGVDSDQYALYKDSENPEKADVILTSMLKEVGNSLVSIMHSIESGDDSMWGHTTRLGLAQDSVGIADNDYYEANTPDELKAQIAEASEKIKSGELKVKSYYDFADDTEYNAYVESVK
ncbi:MAG: BMP family ABC transporter substrate-binding protein [Galactobacillus timonensis]|jgi:basic membrane protein A|uniref:BMP family lipoprotein n=1 Tax=Galactobacillus timonensis TaxID=2041840 RepID=UPI0015BDFDD6|nr:BMP family ABC transporter substrate-binding protein [Galactobacillus timonensis]MDY6283415.1 BMP family ABC transporter substrate-binding protein [Erysipelotrichaceae bacterium]MCI6067370.1 BMP family ABC transporter substrate-binding protein [Galactobacillus timonensis]MDD5852286.1 BMP family ABC transporter substrate-binding protein [Galactobacillus timonensis]MDD6369262.1 BMP family ABC transporter substrate-binding protein [Galactobacillus timonensis]MDD6599232.1 BMP family ABC transpo